MRPAPLQYEDCQPYSLQCGGAFVIANFVSVRTLRIVRLIIIIIIFFQYYYRKDAYCGFFFFFILCILIFLFILNQFLKKHKAD